MGLHWPNENTKWPTLEDLLLHFEATWSSLSIEILYDWPIIVDCGAVGMYVAFETVRCWTKILIKTLKITANIIHTIIVQSHIDIQWWPVSDFLLADDYDQQGVPKCLCMCRKQDKVICVATTSILYTMHNNMCKYQKHCQLQSPFAGCTHCRETRTTQFVLFSNRIKEWQLSHHKLCNMLMDLIHYSFAPLILFRVPYTLDLLP